MIFLLCLAYNMNIELMNVKNTYHLKQWSLSQQQNLTVILNKKDKISVSNSCNST